MKIGIDSSVFSLAPDFVRYVVTAKNVQNQEHNEELLALLRHEEARIRESAEFEDIKAHPRLAVWRNLFTSFGINPNRCPPSVANLIKRTRSGKDLPFVNSLVCIFNTVCLRHSIPAGGDDMDVVSGDVMLARATGAEIYVPLGSTRESDEVEHPKEGEVILVDTGSSTVLCRAWCWKNGDTTKITPDTKNVAINLDIMTSVISREEGAELASTVKELLEKHCRAHAEIHMLAPDHLEFEF